MSADLGRGPDEQRHAELLEVLTAIRSLFRELVDESRATRRQLEEECTLLRQAMREARR